MKFSVFILNKFVCLEWMTRLKFSINSTRIITIIKKKYSLNGLIFSETGQWKLTSIVEQTLFFLTLLKVNTNKSADVLMALSAYKFIINLLISWFINRCAFMCCFMRAWNINFQYLLKKWYNRFNKVNV